MEGWRLDGQKDVGLWIDGQMDGRMVPQDAVTSREDVFAGLSPQSRLRGHSWKTPCRQTFSPRARTDLWRPQHCQLGFPQEQWQVTLERIPPQKHGEFLQEVTREQLPEK